MEIERFELQNMLNSAAQLAVKLDRIENGKEKAYISENQARKRYGEGTVTRWIKEGLIKFTQDGTSTSPKRFSVYQLELLAKSSNRSTYLPVKERREMLSKALIQNEVNI
jgi:hypothetical protein